MACCTKMPGRNKNAPQQVTDCYKLYSVLHFLILPLINFMIQKDKAVRVHKSMTKNYQSVHIHNMRNKAYNKLLFFNHNKAHYFTFTKQNNHFFI